MCCACSPRPADAPRHAVARRVRALGRRQARAEAARLLSVPRDAYLRDRQGLDGRLVGEDRPRRRVALHVRQAQSSAPRSQVTIPSDAPRPTSPRGWTAKTVRLFTVTPTRPARTRRGARSTAPLAGARVALTTRGAPKALRTALKLKRTPSTATLGKLTVGVAPTRDGSVHARARPRRSPPRPRPPRPRRPRRPTPDAGTSIECPRAAATGLRRHARGQRRLVRLRPARQRRPAQLDRLRPAPVRPPLLAADAGDDRRRRRGVAPGLELARTTTGSMLDAGHARIPDGYDDDPVRDDHLHDARARHRRADRRTWRSRSPRAGSSGTVYADGRASRATWAAMSAPRPRSSTRTSRAERWT